MLPSPTESDSEPVFATGPTRRCAYCGTSSTPMWRHGPGSYQNLCNSCGVKWRRGKILQSASLRHPLSNAPAAVRRATKTDGLDTSKNQHSHKNHSSINADAVCKPKENTSSPILQKKEQETQHPSDSTLEFAHLLRVLPLDRVEAFAAVLMRVSGSASPQFSLAVNHLTRDTWRELRTLAM